MCEITSKVELKPCPLCGHDKLLFYAHDQQVGTNGNVTTYRVRCLRCNLMLSRLRSEEVVEVWNKRNYTVEQIHLYQNSFAHSFPQGVENGKECKENEVH